MPDPHAIQGRAADAGLWDDEDLFNPDTDRYDRRKLRIKCPGCGRTGSPLCSPRTVVVDSGWMWIGMDHKDPFVAYQTTCRCGQEYRFTIHTPQ